MAAKPRAWPKIFLPWLVGFALVFQTQGEISFSATCASLGYAFFDVLFILFVNDWADQEVDALRRRILPQSSPKTIADGVLPAHTVLRVGLVSLVLALACAIWASWLRQELSVAILGIFGLSLFAAYSLPPLRINDLGGGEVLEAIGVALVLPIFVVHAQSSLAQTLAVLKLPLGWGFLLGFFMLSLAGAVASGLGDEQSDRLGGKRTWVVLVGNRVARRTIEALVFATGTLWLVVALVWEWKLVFPGLVAWVAFVLVVRQSSIAAHDAPHLATYKNALRSGMGGCIAVFCLTLFLGTFIES